MSWTWIDRLMLWCLNAGLILFGFVATIFVIELAVILWSGCCR